MRWAAILFVCVSLWGQSLPLGGIPISSAPTACATPTFDPVAGTYSGTQNVTINLAVGCTGCYTTDGSDPAAAVPGTCSAGSTYSTPVSVASSLTIKALATKAALTNSAIGSAAYTINAALNFGVDFRATAAYVTDPADTTYSLGAVYPTVRGGQTFGWDTNRAGGARDRNAGIDPRLAGIVNNASNAVATFELDLPPGTYLLTLAIGDPSFVTHTWASVYDDATLLATVLNDVTIAAGSVADATGTVYTDANWPSSQQPISITLSSTSAPGGKSKLLIKLGNALSSSQTPLQHLFVEQQ